MNCINNAQDDVLCNFLSLNELTIGRIFTLTLNLPHNFIEIVNFVDLIEIETVFFFFYFDIYIQKSYKICLI